MKLHTRTVIAGIFIILAIGAIILYLRGNSSADKRPQTASIVRIEQPRVETILDELEFTGDILPIQQASIYSKVSGNLDNVYVDIGSPVRAGQLLAQIDTTELFQQYQQAAATYDNARLTFQRNKELIDQNLIARQDLDNAEASMKVAKSAFETAKTKLGYASITAPFAGTITKRYLDQGANVTSNNVNLFMLMDMSAMKIIIPVQEKDLPRVAKGKKALIRVDAYPGQTFEGVATRLSQAVDLTTRTMDVEIDIPNQEKLLKPGMYANVILIVGVQKNGLTLPTMALAKDEQGTYIFVVEGNTAHRRTVTPGRENNGRTQIFTGLSPKENVVTVGQQFVKDGNPVTIQQ
jgi:membrane fusion protein (multidrug efflux system)